MKKQPAQKSPFYFLYILECVNGAYYTGIAIDPADRWSKHLSGVAAKYTRSFPPKAMVALWKVCESRSLAQKLESKVKSLNRLEKMNLVAQPNTIKDLILPLGLSLDTVTRCDLLS